MSLTISLDQEQVQQYLRQAGLRCEFTAAERQPPPTTPVVDTHVRMFVYPTPHDNSELTLSNLRNIFGTDPQHQPCFFDHPWYLQEAFMHAPAPPGWHILAMDVLTESVGQPADYIRRIPSYVLPQAAEVILMLFLYYMKTGEQLLFKKHTWCGDQASLGRQVTVGAFGRNGVFISGHPPNYSSRGLGTCPKIA